MGTDGHTKLSVSMANALASDMIQSHFDSMNAPSSPLASPTDSISPLNTWTLDHATFFDHSSVAQSSHLESRKNQILDSDQDAVLELSKELDFRIQEGHGEFILDLGFDGASISFNFSRQELDRCLEKLESAAKLIQTTVSSITIQTDDAKSYTAHALLRKSTSGLVENVLEIRIACVGNVDAGKSTLLGVLTSGYLDDGRGHARLNLFKHEHEIESGRTSSVGMEIMGFDESSNLIAHSIQGRKLRWEDISTWAFKVLTFLDLAGHEKYLKTTVFGMTGWFDVLFWSLMFSSPDYVMLIIGSNNGVIGMTKEHLGLALALNVPVFAVITKVDMCPPNVLETTIKQLIKVLKSSGCRKIPLFVKSIEDVMTSARNFISERVCPVFQVSNVTGVGLPFLKQFLNILPSYKNYDEKSPAEFQITDLFSVPVSGTLLSGLVHTGESMLLGPDSLGHFFPCVIKSIQRKRVAVPLARAGQSVSFALKKVRRAHLRKGMVMLSRNVNPLSYWEFEAEILTISPNYQAMLHCGNVRQTACIVSIIHQHAESKNSAITNNVNNAPPSTAPLNTENNATTTPSTIPLIRTGDRATVRFRFMLYPEYLRVGSRLLFREGRTKGVGKITALFLDAE